MAVAKPAGRDLEWSGLNRWRLRLAQEHGCREDSKRSDWDPPEGWDELPSRDWCRAFYELHAASEFRRRFAKNPAWADVVAAWDPDPEWRARAAGPLAAEHERRRRLAATFLGEEDPYE